MGDQVTSATLRTRWDGAKHHMLVIEAGKLGLNESHHGAVNRWDWGMTLATLIDAQDRETQADRLVRQMSAAERASLWAPDPAVDQREQALLRRAAVRMAPFAALTEQVRRMP